MAAAPPTPRVSIVVLTYNEERNVEDCLLALAAQTVNDFEVLLIDAASTDRTVEIARRVQRRIPLPLHIEVAPRRISVGEARNLGVALARAPIVGFLSADTEPHPQWVEHALARSKDADLVFGRQLHSPNRHSIGAAVRGLRYHFPDTPTEEAAKYASNVNAVVRRAVLLQFPFGTSPGASAVDDILLTQRATKAGYRVAYEPGMVVRHRDVETWRQEFIKNRREGLGLGEFRSEIGFNLSVLTWGILVVAAAALLVLRPTLVSALLFIAILWAPATRRAVRRLGHMPMRDIAVGFLASPPFDLTFLLAYVRGLLARRTPARVAPPTGKEVQP